MSEEDKIKFAVVGFGHIGKRHAEMIRRHPEAALVAICDIKSPSELALDNLDVSYFFSIDSLLSSGFDLDVICICTPNGLHAEQSIQCLQHKKHVVIEKPMALKVEDCKKILATAAGVSRNVFCVMQNRFSPPAAWIKEVINKNYLGNIFLVQMNCFWNRDDRYYSESDWKGTMDDDGGTLFTQFSHFIDMMNWLFGDITDIHASFADFNHQQSTAFEDSGTVTFRFINGGIGNLNYSTSVWDKNFESSMTIIGENGSVKIGGQYMNEVIYCHIKNYEMPTLGNSNPANDYGNYKGSAANHHFIIENVVDTLKKRSSLPTNAMDGLKVVDIIERIYSSRKIYKEKKEDFKSSGKA